MVTTAMQRSSCCLCETSKWRSRLLESSFLDQSYSIFVPYYTVKRCVILILCALRWGVRKRKQLNHINLVLCAYFLPVNDFSKQKRAMRRIMRNPCKLKVRCYTARLIDINDHLDTFPGEKQVIRFLINSLMEYFWTVWQRDGLRKRMCRVLTVKLLL